MKLDTRLTVLVSSPKPDNLSDQQRRFLDALEQYINAKGLRLLPEPAMTDSLSARYGKLRIADGILVVAFSQWTAERLYRRQTPVLMPSEFNHIESAFATAAGKPLLALREKDLGQRGALRPGGLTHVVRLPRSLDPAWLDTREFASEFDKWLDDLKSRRHVFLGYSSQAANVANAVFKFLTETMGLRVLDWHEFRQGASIWESIERAERLTTCGLFLFMADDHVTSGGKRELAPRDNVVIEAGYFAGAKGRKNALIICETGAKVPTDFGGILFFELKNRFDISPIETALRECLESILTGQSNGN